MELMTKMESNKMFKRGVSCLGDGIGRLPSGIPVEWLGSSLGAVLWQPPSYDRDKLLCLGSGSEIENDWRPKCPRVRTPYLPWPWADAFRAG